MANIRNLLGRTPSARRRTAARPTEGRVTLVVGLGTTGLKADRLIWERFPSLRGMVLVLDGEVQRDEANRFDHRIATPDMKIDDYLAKVDQEPLLAADPLIGAARFPHESERGAGTCRMIGLLKGSFALDTLRQKAARALHRRLAQPVHSQERMLVDIHIVVAAGGGFGSPLIIPTAIVLRDQVRALCPQARCSVIVHLVLASHFIDRIHEPAIRTKVQANDLATMLEINHAHQPDAVARLCTLLDCEPLTAPTFGLVIPYHVGDEWGRAASLEQVLSDRVLPNILAGENAGLMNLFRERAANLGALLGSTTITGPQPIVSVCQAAAAARAKAARAVLGDAGGPV